MDPETVLVTGASGSVGHFLVQNFLDEGYKVVASDLPDTPLPKRKKNLSIRAADLTDEKSHSRLVKDVNVVVHTAALIDIALPFDRLEAVNVTATKQLYQAAAGAGVKRFVFFSSGSAYQFHPSQTYTEDMPLTAGNDYEQTKILCEEYLKGQTGGPEVVVIRPSLIYGPRGKMLGAALACIAPLMHEFLPVMIGLSGGPRSNWVHAEDVARATAHLTRHGQAGEAYNVCDDDAIPFGDIIPVAAEAYGLKSSFTIPYPSLGLMGKIGPALERAGPVFERLNRILAKGWAKVCDKHGLARELTPKIDAEAMAYAYRHTIFVNDKLKATGFEFKYPSIRDGMPSTIKWYQENRWVPKY